jgi:hypothetical protein
MEPDQASQISKRHRLKKERPGCNPAERKKHMTFHILGTAEMQERIAGYNTRHGGDQRPPLTCEDVTEAMSIWTKTRSVADALSRKEIGALRSFDRLDVLKKSLILGLSLYYENNPNADAAPGVLALVTLMSDNEHGVCTMGHVAMGEVLHRTRTTIASAVGRLKDGVLIDSENGKSGSNPVIPPVLAAQYNHVVWLINALRPVGLSQQVGASTCRAKPTGDLSGQANRSEKPVGLSQQVGGEPVGLSQHNLKRDLPLTLSMEESHHSLSDLQDRKPDCTSAEEPAKTDLLEDASGQAIAEAAAKDAKPKPKRQKKAKPANGRPNYSDDFVAFWLAYPRHPNMSKANAFTQWGHLDAEDREWATKAAEAYRAQQQRKAQQESLSSEDIAHKTKHAERFLKDRRFEAYREHVEGKQAAAAKEEATFGGMPKSRVIDLIADFFRHGASRWTARVAEVLGVAPGADGCKLPEDLIAAGRAISGS